MGRRQVSKQNRNTQQRQLRRGIAEVVQDLDKNSQKDQLHKREKSEDSLTGRHLTRTSIRSGYDNHLNKIGVQPPEELVERSYEQRINIIHTLAEAALLE